MSVIDSYLEHVDPGMRAELERLRSIVIEMLPDAEETISYAMPTMKYNGKAVLGFDAHKNHIGIYPYSGSVISRITELKAYDTTAGAIREELDNLLPKSLIEKIVRERLKQINQE